MSDQAGHGEEAWRGANSAAPSLSAGVFLLLTGIACFVAAIRVGVVALHLMFYAFAVGLSGVGLLAVVLWFKRGIGVDRPLIAFNAMFTDASTPAFMTDPHGKIVTSNFRAGPDVTDGPREATADEILQRFAPDGAALAYRLMRGLRNSDHASERVEDQGGQPHLISVRGVGDEAIVWTIDSAPSERRGSVYPSSVAAIVSDATGNVVHLNGPARRLGNGHPPDRPEAITLEGRAENGSYVHLKDSARTCVRVHRASRDEGGFETLFLPVGCEEVAGTLPEEFMDALPVALARIDRDGTIIYANEAAQSLLGPKAAQGEALGSVIEGLGRSIPERITDMMGGRSHMRTEVARTTVDDQEVYLQVTLKRLMLDGETSLLAVISDATEFKALEAQFVQSQKMQAVGQLAGGVAHDFNNLLTAISGHCDLLLLRHDRKDTDYNDLVQISQNAMRAAALVGKLLAFSRKQTLMPKVINLYETLTDLKHLLNRLLGEKVMLRIEHGEDLPQIRVDERQLEQVIMNLVVNARDAMTDGGEVTIKTRTVVYEANVERDRATIPFGTYLQIDVTDTGVGIPDDKIAKIFEPFFTTKGVGSNMGQGLSTVRSIIVDRHKGSIEIDSTVGQGTRISLHLPLSI